MNNVVALAIWNIICYLYGIAYFGYMNKYLKRGMIMTALGIAVGSLGMYLKQMDNDFYGIVLTLSVIVFGIGFLTIVYSLIRKIDRQSILETRAKEAEDKKD